MENLSSPLVMVVREYISLPSKSMWYEKGFEFFSGWGEEIVLWSVVQGSHFIDIRNTVISCLSVEYYVKTYYNYYFKVRNFRVTI